MQVLRRRGNRKAKSMWKLWKLIEKERSVGKKKERMGKGSMVEGEKKGPFFVRYTKLPILRVTDFSKLSDR